MRIANISSYRAVTQSVVFSMKREGIIGSKMVCCVGLLLMFMQEAAVFRQHTQASHKGQAERLKVCVDTCVKAWCDAGVECAAVVDIWP